MSKSASGSHKATHCFNCHRPMPKPRFERLTPKLCSALEAIGKASHDGQIWAKIPAYEFQALHPRLRHWGLIEEQILIRDDGSPKRRAGYWRITDEGLLFLQGDLVVEGILRLVEDRVVQKLGPPVDIHGARKGVAQTAKIGEEEGPALSKSDLEFIASHREDEWDVDVEDDE